MGVLISDKELDYYIDRANNTHVDKDNSPMYGPAPVKHVGFGKNGIIIRIDIFELLNRCKDLNSGKRN